MALALALAAPLASAQSTARAASRMADYIVAVVNQELVSNAEVEQRTARIREEAARSKTELPPAKRLPVTTTSSLLVWSA